MKIEEEIQSNFKNDYQKLVVNLYLTYSRLHEPFNEAIKSFDITPTQYNVLRILRGQNQSPVSIGLLKDRMIERNSDVSRIIDRLVKKKLIERSENKSDRRQKDVTITQKGLDLISQMDVCTEKMDERLSHISLDEVILMNNLLDKIRAAPEE